MPFDMNQYRALALRTKAPASDKSLRQVVRSYEFFDEIMQETRDYAPFIDKLKRYGIYGRDDESLVEQLMPTYPIGDKAERIRQCLDLLHGIIGVIGECGEICEKVIEHIDTGSPLDIENIYEESSDILWFLNLIAAFCGKRDLVDVASANIAKLAERYKEKFSLTEYESRDRTKEMLAFNSEATGISFD